MSFLLRLMPEGVAKPRRGAEEEDLPQPSGPVSRNGWQRHTLTRAGSSAPSKRCNLAGIASQTFLYSQTFRLFYAGQYRFVEFWSEKTLRFYQNTEFFPQSLIFPQNGCLRAIHFLDSKLKSLLFSKIENLNQTFLLRFAAVSNWPL